MASVRILTGIVLAIGMLRLPPAASAQFAKIPAAYGFAVNTALDGQVVQLTVPSDYQGVTFLIVWDTDGGQFFTQKRARAGTHSYKMRRHPDWKGIAQTVAITLPNVT